MKRYTQFSKKRTLGVVLMCALASGWPTAATAQTFRACFVPQVGAMYLIDLEGLPTECLAENHEEVSWSEGASSGGAETHAELQGLDGDDHPQYLLAEGERHATDWFALSGTQNVGSIPTPSTGPLMLWYPRKAAFRVGSLGTFSDQQTGFFSFAAGATPIASGQGSVALGSRVTASGRAATGMGLDTQSSGAGATALGQETVASGNFSIAMGQETVASGGVSLAAGFRTEASGRGSIALGKLASTNEHPGAFIFGDGSVFGQTKIEATKGNQFAVRAQHFWLGSSPTITTDDNFLDTSTGAFLSSGGIWTDASSREWKEGFVRIDPATVLERVIALPITEWNYKTEPDDVRHFGPLAEDFYAAFRLGSSEQHIASLDGVGVSLAAIQALTARVERLEEETSTLRSMVDERPLPRKK